MDLLTAPKFRKPSTQRRFWLVVFGAAVALFAWWLIDELVTQQFQRNSRGESSAFQLIGVAVIALAATGLLFRSSISLVAAAATTALGIILGGYGGGSPLITLPSDDAQFTLLRGAHEPAMWILFGVWAAIPLSRFLLTSKRKVWR